MAEIKTFFIIENKPIYKGAAEVAKEKFDNVHKEMIVDTKDVGKAISYMKNRIRMADGDECRFAIFGFDKVDFSEIKDRHGEPVIKHKGVINKKNGR